ncbi:MAG: glycosyltransferase [Phycisphaerales bacterium]|nr:glycosyltransferase [Phycisphaerales bacterium]
MAATRVLMLGWEFPPFIAGGLGTACYGLTKALDKLGTKIIFVLPRPVQAQTSSHVEIRSPDPSTPLTPDVLAALGQPVQADQTLADFKTLEFRTVMANLRPYDRPETFLATGTRTEITPVGATNAALASASSNQPDSAIEKPVVAPPANPAPVASAPAQSGDHYGGDLFFEVDRYAAAVCAVARTAQFDIIHAHDWMTFPAAITVAGFTRKPLVIHVHSTEFDRSGEHVNQRIYDIERAGMHHARRVICVSHLTRQIVLRRYGVSARKIDVIYNGVEDNGPTRPIPPAIERDERIVLFLGRITMQKGPEYFLAAAKKVLDFVENVRFVMAGTGDMTKRMIELAAEMGIGHKVVFTGFLRGEDVRRVFRMADLYVMPSVSEPFGITPLEALSHDVPVLISKQSGVAEVLTHALKVDFWDIDEMTNKIVAVLRHPPLQKTLRDHGRIEIRRITWDGAAERVVQTYQKVLVAP